MVTGARPGGWRRVSGWFRRRPALAAEADRVWQGLRAGQAGVESVLGLPHALVVPLLNRHFAGHAAPSSEAFAATGRDGFWTLPAPHPDVRVQVFGDGSGRLVRGEVSSGGPWAGVCLTSDWSPHHEYAVWGVAVSGPAGAGQDARLDALLKHLDAAGWRSDAIGSGHVAGKPPETASGSRIDQGPGGLARGRGKP